MKRYTEYDLFVGLDVHKDSIAVALASPERSGEIRFYGNINTDRAAVERMFKKLLKRYTTLLVCYEAGPCGYGLYRQLLNMGIQCQIVAPSRIPKSPTDKIKNDHRDAINL